MAVCKLSYGEACQTQTQKGFQIKSSICLYVPAQVCIKYAIWEYDSASATFCQSKWEGYKCLPIIVPKHYIIGVNLSNLESLHFISKLELSVL